MANNIRGITVEIGGNTTGLDRALKGVNDNSRRLQSELKEVNRQLRFDPSNTVLLAQRQQLLAESVSNARDKLAALREAEAQVQEQFERGEIGEEQYRAFQRELELAQNQLENLEGDLEDIGTSASRSFSQAADHIESFGNSAESAGKKMLPITGVIAAAGVAAGKMAMDFEDNIANINTLLDDDSHLQGYEDAIVSLSNETGMATDLMAEGMYQTISSIGDSGKETEHIFETMSKSAKAGGAEVADAVSLISAGMKGYNEVNDETARKISDLAFQTAKLGVTTFPEMAKSMQPLFPLANSLSLSYEELFGVMATGTGVTGNTAEVTTQFKAILSGLMKPTADMGKLIEKYGYSNAQAMIESEGLAGVLQILQDETGGQSDKLATLFGSTEALTLATALTGTQFDTFKEKLGAMGDASGATETAYEKLDTSGDKLRRSFNSLKNTLMDLGVTLMSVIGPAIDSISKKIASFSAWFGSLDEGTKRMIITVAAIVASIGPLLIIIGKLSLGVSALINFGVKIAPMIAKLGPVIKGFFAIIAANPIIAIVAAIAAALIYLWNTNEGFRNAIIAAWDVIKETVSAVASTIVEFFTVKIPAAFTAVIDFIKNNWQGILLFLVNPFAGAFKLLYDNCNGFRTKVQELLSTVVSFFQELPGRIGGFLNALPGIIGTALGQALGSVAAFGVNLYNWAITEIPKVIGSVGTFFAELPGTIGAALSSALQTATQWGSDVQTDLAQSSQNAIQSVVSFFASLPGKIRETLSGALAAIVEWGTNLKNWVAVEIPKVVEQIADFFRQLPEKMAEIGVRLIEGLWKGISDTVGWIKKKANEFCAGFIKGFEDKFEIKSPSRVFIGIGKNIMQGFQRGLDANKKAPVDEMDSLSREILENVKANAESYKDVGSLYIEKFTAGINDRTAKAIEAAQNVVDKNVAALIEKNPKAKAEYEKSGKAVMDAYKESIKQGGNESVAEVKKSLEKITTEAQKQYDNIVQARDSMEKKLAGFGDLFTFGSESKDVTIGNIEAQKRAVEEYAALLDGLKEKGASDEMLQQVTDLGVEEGSRAAKKLLEMQDQDFLALQTLWAEKQQLAKDVAARYYQDQLSALETEFAGKLKTSLAEVPNTVKDIGKSAGDGFILGIRSKKAAAVAEAKALADAVIAEMSRAFDINSPSRVMKNYIAGNAIQGLVDGLHEGIGRVQKASQKVSEAMMVSTVASSARAEQSRSASMVDLVGAFGAQMQLVAQPNQAGDINIAVHIGGDKFGEAVVKQGDAYRKGMGPIKVVPV